MNYSTKPPSLWLRIIQFIATLRDLLTIIRTARQLRRLLNTPYYRVERKIDRYLATLAGVK